MKKFIRKNIITLLAALIGAIGGWLYWYYVGCASGHCMITSKPLNSTLYGTLMGGLLGSIMQPNPKKKNI